MTSRTANRRLIVRAGGLVWVPVLALLLTGIASGTAAAPEAGEPEAAQTEGGICDRTEQVRNEILDKLPDISDCALVTG